jgi:hypothetical protein
MEEAKAGACDVGQRFRIRNNLNPHYAIAWEY